MLPLGCAPAPEAGAPKVATSAVVGASPEANILNVGEQSTEQPFKVLNMDSFMQWPTALALSTALDLLCPLTHAMNDDSQGKEQGAVIPRHPIFQYKLF